MPDRVFISYASADKTIADQVCTTLESAGVACWIAPRNIEPGVHYPTAIIDAVQSAGAMVLVLSDQAQNSPHVVTEVEEAFNKRKPIVPFRLSTAPLSKDLDYFLSLSQWLDAPDGATPGNLERLTAAVKAALSGQPAALEHRPEPLPVRRWRWAIPVAVLALGVVAYWQWPRPAPQALPEPRPPEAPAKEKAAPEFPKSRVNPADGQEYMWIPAGRFTMGCSAGDGECAPDEQPSHPVEIEKGFWLGKTEVTAAAFSKATTDGDLPAAGMSWAAAKAYCAKIGGRLPTEAEWEYAARGGRPESLYGPLPKIAWYEGNSDGHPHPVARKAPNAYGLYDMLGNVSEWVLDRYYNRYDLEAPAAGPDVEQPRASNAEAVIRGSFWATPAAGVRVSRRASRPPDEPDVFVGFRCALDGQ